MELREFIQTTIKEYLNENTNNLMLYHGSKNNFNVFDLKFFEPLINNPKILILDEPTVGFDPLNRALFFQILADLKIQTLSLGLTPKDKFCFSLQLFLTLDKNCAFYYRS